VVFFLASTRLTFPWLHDLHLFSSLGWKQTRTSVCLLTLIARGGSSAFNSYIIRDTPPPTTTKKKQFSRSRQREETAIIITLSEFVSRLQMCIPSRPGSHTKRCVSHSHTKSAISPRVQTLCWCERVTCLWNWLLFHFCECVWVRLRRIGGDRVAKYWHNMGATMDWGGRMIGCLQVEQSPRGPFQ